MSSSQIKDFTAKLMELVAIIGTMDAETPKGKYLDMSAREITQFKKDAPKPRHNGDEWIRKPDLEDVLANFTPVKDVTGGKVFRDPNGAPIGFAPAFVMPFSELDSLPAYMSNHEHASHWLWVNKGDVPAGRLISTSQVYVPNVAQDGTRKEMYPYDDSASGALTPSQFCQILCGQKGYGADIDAEGNVLDLDTPYTEAQVATFKKMAQTGFCIRVKF